MKHIQGLEKQRLETVLEKMKKVKAVLIGDMCLDVYWVADMTKSVLSRETPHFPLPIVEERFSAGAGANAAVNMKTLCDNFIPIGVVGDDWRGVCLKTAFEREGILDKGLVVAKGHTTNAYCKPMRKGYLGIEVEDPRLDFESYEPISAELEDKIIQKLETYANKADILCVSDQFENGCITEKVRKKINEIAESGILTIVDSRYRIDKFSHCILKPNEIECARVVSKDLSKDACEDDFLAAAKALSKKTKSDVCLTLGSRGCLIYRGKTASRIQTIPVPPPLDTVGAGDCFLSGFSLALAAGATEYEAGVIGTMASTVCVKKLNTTGSASKQELLDLFEEYGEEA
jgi:rfaE bifunctional protein kinase chain/domain